VQGPSSNDDPLIAATRVARAVVEGAAFPFTHSVSALVGTARAMGAMTAPLLDPRVGVELMRLHQVFDDVTLVRPLVSSDVLHATARIASHEAHAQGSLLVVDVQVSDSARAPVLQWRAGILLRGARKRMDVEWPDAAPREGHGAVSAERAVVVDRALALTFATASGDANPMFSDDGAARMAGLPGAIVSPRALAFLAMTALEHDAERTSPAPSRFITAGARPVSMGARVVVRTHLSTAGERSATVVDESGVVLVHARAVHA
jgi:acyl dehydratase